jgi:hypothetical protein
MAMGCTLTPDDDLGFGSAADGTSGPAATSDAADDADGGDTGGGDTGDTPADGSASGADDGSTSGGSTSDADGGSDSTTTGEVGMVGGGCDHAATTVLQTDINGAVFQGALRYPGSTFDAPYASVLVMAPADLCELTITIDPAGTDDLQAVLREGNDLPIAGADCSAQAGAPCTIELPDGPDTEMMLRVQMRDPTDDNLGQIQLSISAKTEGLAAANGVDWSFRNKEQADYVVWPVGPATGSYTYDWETTTQTPFNIAMISPGGAMSPALETLAPPITQWPASGTPQGWYILGISTTNPTGMDDGWTFGLTP